MSCGGSTHDNANAAAISNDVKDVNQRVVATASVDADAAYHRGRYEQGITGRKFADPRSAERVETLSKKDGSEVIIFAGQGTDGLPVYAVQERYTAADGAKDVTTPVHFDTLENAQQFAAGQPVAKPYIDLRNGYMSNQSAEAITNPVAQTYIAAIRQSTKEEQDSSALVIEKFIGALRATGQYDEGTLARWEEEATGAVSGYSRIPHWALDDGGAGDEERSTLDDVMAEITGDDKVGGILAYDLIGRTESNPDLDYGLPTGWEDWDR